MLRGPGLNPFTLPLILLASLFFVGETPALAQNPIGGGSQGRGQGGAQSLDSVTVTVLVSVREIRGTPLTSYAVVKLSRFGSAQQTASTQEGSTASFPNIFTGEYDLEVEAPGYKPAKEHASIISGGTSFTVYVYMQPESESQPANAPPGSSIMTPQLQSEIDKGLNNLRLQKFDAARTHLEKAAKMAPGNPDVQYLLGMLEYTQHHDDLARTRFEAAISISPAHERALVALGEIQLRAGQSVQAAQTLEKAYQVNGADWRMLLLLAYAYSGQKEYEKARPHAARAAQLAGARGAPAQLLLGQILAAEGKRDEAKLAFETTIRTFPNDSAAQDAKAGLVALDKSAVAVVATSTAAATPAPPPAPAAIPATPPVLRPWAPPDVDTREYPLAADVPCSQDEVLRRTQVRTMKQLANLEKFSAMERIEHQEFDFNGNPGPVKSRDFTYLVFIQHPKKGSLFIDEQRDGGQNLSSFPTSIASTGLVAFGVFLFTTDYESDFTYKCEGLGDWRGQAAWQIRFEQRKETPSRLFTWKNNHGIFPVPLKGRVWVAANTYDVMHVETDLREPVPQLELLRNHLMIDYGPVQFAHANTSLWLPEFAELYMELHAKRYHHRHKLTHYELFSVDTGFTVAPPVEK